MSTELAKSEPNPIDTRGILGDVLEKLTLLLASVESYGDGEHPSTVADAARLATAIITACGELRQHEKRDARTLASFPLEQVVAMLKALPADKREKVCRDVLGTDDGDPLL